MKLLVLSTLLIGFCNTFAVNVFFDKEANVLLNPEDLFVVSHIPLQKAKHRGLLEDCKEALMYKQDSQSVSNYIKLCAVFYDKIYPNCKELMEDLLLIDQIISESIIVRQYSIVDPYYDAGCETVMRMIKEMYKETCRHLHETSLLKHCVGADTEISRTRHFYRMQDACKQILDLLASIDGNIAKKLNLFNRLDSIHKTIVQTFGNNGSLSRNMRPKSPDRPIRFTEDPGMPDKPIKWFFWPALILSCTLLTGIWYKLGQAQG